MHIGKFKHDINVASEFHQLSKNDEFTAEIMASTKHYRQACYLIVQAIEKAIRSKIFSLVNPNIEYFRNRNRTHSVEDAIDFLLEILSTDNLIRGQILNQIHSHVLGKTKYMQLHNNLRYPSYFKKYDSYSIIIVDEDDYKELKRRLFLMRKFLDDLGKFQ